MAYNCGGRIAARRLARQYSTEAFCWLHCMPCACVKSQTHGLRLHIRCSIPRNTKIASTGLREGDWICPACASVFTSEALRASGEVRITTMPIRCLATDAPAAAGAVDLRSHRGGLPKDEATAPTPTQKSGTDFREGDAWRREFTLLYVPYTTRKVFRLERVHSARREAMRTLRTFLEDWLCLACDNHNFDARTASVSCIGAAFVSFESFLEWTQNGICGADIR